MIYGSVKWIIASLNGQNDCPRMRFFDELLIIHLCCKSKIAIDGCRQIIKCFVCSCIPRLFACFYLIFFAAYFVIGTTVVVMHE